MTPRQFLLVTAAAADRDQAERAKLAWMTAVLTRAKKVPPLQDMLPRPPQSPEERAAEMKAAMATYRKTAAARGKMKAWSEWLH